MLKSKQQSKENSTLGMFANVYVNPKPARPLLSLNILCGIRKNIEQRELSQ